MHGRMGPLILDMMDGERQAVTTSARSALKRSMLAWTATASRREE